MILKKLINLKFVLLVITFGYFLFFSTAIATEKLNSKCPLPIQIAEEANWQPFTIEEKGIASKGLSYDLMKLIFNRIGCRVDLYLYPQARMLQLVANGDKDGVSVISKNAERESYLHFIYPPLVTRKAYVYVNKKRNKDLIFTNWESLKGKKIGIIKGYNYPKSFHEARKNIPLEVVEHISSSQSFELLAINRIDAILSMDAIANEYLAQSNLYKVITNLQKPYETYDYHLAVSKKSKTMFLIKDLKKTIELLHASGEINYLLKKYSLD